MNISELSMQTTEPKASMSRQNQADFGRWLDSAEQWQQFSNPEKQSTGDEYYWQHQNHLQHSELSFDAKPEMTAPPKKTANNPSKTAINTSVLAHHTPESFHLVFDAIEKPAQLSICMKEAVLLLAELNYSLEQSNTAYALVNGTYSPQATAPAQAQNIPINSLNHRIEFKNIHLFIEENQAELTLNMQHFNKEEKKELVNLIQEHLKRKGLILSRLIINGVKND